MVTTALKQQLKQGVRRTIGEPYVGKRLKMRRLEGILPSLGLDPSTILDAGTEDATFTYWLAERFPRARITAVDIDESAIAACSANVPTKLAARVEFRVQHFADLPADSFDLICAFDVLEHIDEDGQAVDDLRRALRPGGTLLVHVPRDRWRTRAGVIHRVPDAEAWKINPGHVRQGYSPEGMRDLLTASGLDVLDVQTWIGRWGTLAHDAYTRLEHPTALRLLSIPVTDVCARLDQRRPTQDGNTVFARAIRPV